jgi:hypothetical protein
MHKQMPLCGTVRSAVPCQCISLTFFCMAQQPLVGQGLLIIEASRSHFRHITLGRTPLDEGLARRRDLYLTTRNTHNRQTSMPPAGFEATIPASERPQTHAFDRAATAIGLSLKYRQLSKIKAFNKQWFL